MSVNVVLLLLLLLNPEHACERSQLLLTVKACTQHAHLYSLK
jgi:hypothetical protein